MVEYQYATNYQIGDEVSKIGGDYSFRGQVVSVIKKRSGKIRYAVEDDRGILHIFKDSQLELVNRSPGEPR